MNVKKVMKTKKQWDSEYNKAKKQLDEMQESWDSFMAGECITWEEWIAEDDKERETFFAWFKKQKRDNK